MADEFIPLTVDDCQEVIERYGLGSRLWHEFWNHMSKQSDAGAPYEYIESCYETLLTEWDKRTNGEIS